jgi:hypothetical protein
MTNYFKYQNHSCDVSHYQLLCRISELQKIIKAFISVLDVVSLHFRTPRSSFAMNEENVCVCYTDPPIRGVQVHMQTLISFLASKARGGFHHTFHTRKFKEGVI